MKSFGLSLGEKVLALSGIFVLASVFVLYFSGNFVVFIAAKLLYGAGIILFLFDK